MNLKKIDSANIFYKLLSLSYFSDSKKKKKPVGNQSETCSKNFDSRLSSGPSSSGALRPDQLYTSAKNSSQSSMLDAADNVVNMNGSLISPLSSEPSISGLKNEALYAKDRRDTYLKDSDLANYGNNSSNSKLDKFNSRGNEPFSMLNDYVDLNGSKYKNPTRSAKINNGDSDSIRTEYERMGNKSQAWTNRSKQDESNSGPSTNERTGKGISCKDQIIHSLQDSNGEFH